ncbi:MAG: BamA/TamA family outer membrane protein [Rhodospirillales bacterium]|nr:BamA/TamA family outer membrane protein [Rhodospirillales bacterium]
MILFSNGGLAQELRGLNEDQASLKTYLQELLTARQKQSSETTETSFIETRKLLEQGLKAKGYYHARIYRETAGEAGEEDVLRLKTGPVYQISTIEISGVPSDQKRPVPLTIQTGENLLAEKVLKAQRELKAALSAGHCYYYLSVSHELRLNHTNHTGALRFIVTVAPEVSFGAVSFTGAESLKRSYLSKYLLHREGACWSMEKIEDTKTALLQTGLIGRVDAVLPETVTKGEAVPVTYGLKERAPRTVKLGANYNTSEGPGVGAGWTHRNFLGAGETFEATGKFSSVLQSLGIDFSKPFFLSPRQSLQTSALLSREQTDAYEQIGLGVQASLERTLSKFWSGSMGGGLEGTQIKEDGLSRTYGLISIPGSLSYDNRDDVLDPHRGAQLKLTSTPYLDAFGEAAPFYKNRITGMTYFDLSAGRWDPVLALRASVGSILGDVTEDVPANKRFYTGGGGSIRGFGYQEAGPVENGDPVGGRSLLETNTELRFKLSKTIGAVAFVDAGGVYDSPWPDLAGGVYLGAGIGGRYYTSFGPVRFDIGVPLNKKDQVAKNFQLYISIGQAF